MGIKGLYGSVLEPWSRSCNVREFRGCSVGVDAYSWLHSGADSCAMDLATGVKTTEYVTVVMEKIEMLIQCDVKPVVVLDGRDLPAKEIVTSKRREERVEMKRRGLDLLTKGREEEAQKCFRRSIKITHEMALKLIHALRVKKIDYVVAPYEADAQLAYLARQGLVECVITPDSDLVLFGCPKVLFQMDGRGNGWLFERRNFVPCLGLSRWREKIDYEELRWMCILAGCDYSQSGPVLGLDTAMQLMVRPHYDVLSMLHWIPNALKQHNFEITPEHLRVAYDAENTFLYQLVFDTKQRRVVPLTPYPPRIKPKDVPYAGVYETDKVYFELALGNVHKDTLEIVDKLPDPVLDGYGPSSIWWTEESSWKNSGSAVITCQLGNLSLQA